MISSNELGNVGNLLSGITIVVIFFQYRKYKKEQDSNEYWGKIKRTFKYIERLKGFYSDYIFLNIRKYIDNVTKRESVEKLKIWDPDKKFESSGVGAEEIVRMQIVEVYTFFKEISYILIKNKDYSLIDENILKEYFKNYTFQINDFFIASNIILGLKGTALKSNNLFGWGYFDEADLQKIRKILQENLNFIA